MKVWQLAVGLEHLQTGIEFICEGNLSFVKDTPTIMLAWSYKPFKSCWRVVETHQPIVVDAYLSDAPTGIEWPWTDFMIREQVLKNQKAADILR